MINQIKEKKRILIVDDEKSIRDCIIRILTKEHLYELAEASNYTEAQNQFLEFNPDLIVLDVKMPEKNGYHFCMYIRDRLKISEIKIVAISGVSKGIGRTFMLTLGADCYFEKPFDVKIFRNKIRQLLYNYD